MKSWNNEEDMFSLMKEKLYIPGEWGTSWT